MEDRLIIELKTAKALVPENETQILGYLKSSRLEHGLSINFGSYKFEIRKFRWAIGKPRGARRTRKFSGLLVSAAFAGLTEI